MSKLDGRTCQSCGAALSATTVAKHLAEGIQHERMPPLICQNCVHEDEDKQKCTGCGNMVWNRVLITAVQKQYDELLCSFCIKKYDSTAEILYQHQELIAALRAEVEELKSIVKPKKCPHQHTRPPEHLVAPTRKT